MSKEMVIEVWSKEGDIIENLPKVEKETSRLGLILCMAVISSVRTGLFHLHVERNGAADLKISFRRFASWLLKDIRKSLAWQNVNAYGKDFEDIDYRLGDLMEEIRKIDIPRMRFTTSHLVILMII